MLAGQVVSELERPQADPSALPRAEPSAPAIRAQLAAYQVLPQFIRQRKQGRRTSGRHVAPKTGFPFLYYHSTPVYEREYEVNVVRSVVDNASIVPQLTDRRRHTGTDGWMNSP